MADEQIEPILQRPGTEEPRNYGPMIIGLVVVLLVVAAAAFFLRDRGSNTAADNPYAAKLQVSDMKLSQADNFVGSRVTYLDFKLTNAGDKTLTGGRVDATFQNTMGQVVQKEVLPLRVLTPNQLGGYPDLLDLSMANIAPGATKTIRVTLEHVSNDWNQAAPDLKFVDLQLK